MYVIVVASQKGGAGKTSLLRNLAVALTRLTGRRSSSTQIRRARLRAGGTAARTHSRLW